MNDSARLLAYWMRLATLSDQDGLPVDLMYYVLQQKEALPQVISKGQIRSVTETEFAQGIRDCVAIRQGRSPKGAGLTPEQVKKVRELALLGV